MPHEGLEPASVLHLAFQPDALPAEVSLPLVDRKRDLSVIHMGCNPLLTIHISCTFHESFSVMGTK